MYFQYGQEETEYLSGKDEKLGAVIAQVGRVNREVDTDLFSAVVHHIVGQQISTKAQATIWQRMRGALGTVDAEHILEAGNEQLQLLGISCRKAEYITDYARKIQNGEFDLEGIWQIMPPKRKPRPKRQHPLVPTRRKHQKYNRKGRCYDVHRALSVPLGGNSAGSG